MSILHTLRSKIGNNDFRDLLIGKYRIPQEKNRVFMFLDLNSSTTIAEKRGHHLYSRLIQDCFRDLNESLLKTEAEVYQYVGDEAVLSWPIERAFENANCLQAYFFFRQSLEKRKEYYERTYGLIPVFKAGVNMGEATVVEVGVLKRTIVYHSDVLNAAARIQALCNEYDKRLLISESIREQPRFHPFLCCCQAPMRGVPLLNWLKLNINNPGLW